MRKDRSFEEFLVAAREWAMERKVDEILGLRLLHRHHQPESDEAMVETLEEKALVTRPECLGKLGNAVPASWILATEGLRVFEYSRDPKVLESFPKVTLSLLKELETIIRKFSFESVLAPSIDPRGLY